MPLLLLLLARQQQQRQPRQQQPLLRQVRHRQQQQQRGRPPHPLLLLLVLQQQVALASAAPVAAAAALPSSIRRPNLAVLALVFDRGDCPPSARQHRPAMMAAVAAHVLQRQRRQQHPACRVGCQHSSSSSSHCFRLAQPCSRHRCQREEGNQPKWRRLAPPT